MSLICQVLFLKSLAILTSATDKRFKVEQDDLTAYWKSKKKDCISQGDQQVVIYKLITDFTKRK